MAIRYSMDKVNIRRLKDRYVLMIVGWCISTEGSLPRMRIEINGTEETFDAARIVRYDVCNTYKLRADASKCGFMFYRSNLAELQSVRLTAEADNTEKTLLNLKKKNIEHLSEADSIIFGIDAAGFSAKENKGFVNGWAFSVCGTPIEFYVKDRDGKRIPCNNHISSRDDLYKMNLVDKDHKYCGFSLDYPGNEKNHYHLIMKTDDSETEEDLSQYYAESSRIRRMIKQLNTQNIHKGINYLKNNGPLKFIRRLLMGANTAAVYNSWFERNKITEQELQKQRKHTFAYAPKISILVPTYNTPEHLLIEMVESVRKQSYPNWELCIADGSSPDHIARKTVQKYAEEDTRIKVTLLDRNYGISGNTNKALELATGEYTGMFDHDDLLEPDLLYEVVNSLQEIRHDIVYTDEDKLNGQTGKFEDPNMKPDWSPDLFNSHNYITHFFCCRTDIIHEIGGFRSEYDGSQDYDLMFRCIEKAKSIHHIPKVLYHWRMVEGSTAMNPESKLYCYEAGRKAIETHLERTGVKGTVTRLEEPFWGLYHVKYDTGDHPLVSVIIPNYEHKDILKTCIDSLFAVNTYSNIEIVIIENNSKSQEIFDYYKELQEEHENIKVVTWSGKEFNFSAINNYGVQFASGEYFLFLNNDTEMIAPDAIEEMLGCCMRKEVGIVGAKLLYDDDTIQHAGVVIGFGGYAGHVFCGQPSALPGYMMRSQINCNYSAVTAACMMTKKSVFEEVGGFDESFKVAGNDVDFCLKVRETGKLVVYNAFALWHHYESKSRGYEDSREKLERFNREVEHFREKWPEILKNGDPYYNTNFKMDDAPFVLR